MAILTTPRFRRYVSRGPLCKISQLLTRLSTSGIFLLQHGGSIVLIEGKIKMICKYATVENLLPLMLLLVKMWKMRKKRRRGREPWSSEVRCRALEVRRRCGAEELKSQIFSFSKLSTSLSLCASGEKSFDHAPQSLTLASLRCSHMFFKICPVCRL